MEIEFINEERVYSIKFASLVQMVYYWLYFQDLVRLKQGVQIPESQSSTQTYPYNKFIHTSVRKPLTLRDLCGLEWGS